MARAATDTSRMNGNITRVRVMVSAALAGSKPGASSPTSQGEALMPSNVMALSTTIARVQILLASRQAAASPSLTESLLKVVVKAVDRAPSANRSRSRLGIRKAIVNASISLPPPNKAEVI